ncbi:MAG TPA: TonB-dependent receptor [Sphingomicrobium sp.]|nr:TonB-dependent receptor [Sphingomicrobium sp.]
MRKSVWLLSAGLVALSCPAYAQDTSQQPAGTEPSPTEQAAVEPEGQAAAEAEPGEIIVTAQGRRQVLQDVPIAVTAIGGDEMEKSGVTDIRQLNQLAPSLLVSSTGTEANGSARIRGIGTVGDNPGLESSVAVFIDGVYRSRSGIGLNEMGELDRVEVLRGPQGTLFGRNASAGLLNIISKRPSYNFEGYGEATIGNYDYRRLAGGITGGFSDTLAGRLDVVYVKRDGFYDDAANDTTINNRNRIFTRAQLLFEPTDAISFRLIGDYTWRKERCCAAVFVNDSMNDSVDGLLDPAQNNIIRVLRDLGQDITAFDDGFDRNVSVTPGRGYDGKTKDGGISLEGKFELGAAELTSITGYRSYSADQGGDLDYGTVDILYRPDDGTSPRKFKTFSQEIRLNGTIFNDKLDWLVGGYYANEDLTLKDRLRFGSQYGQFATCRLITGSPLAGVYSPSSPSCINPALRPNVSAAFGAAGPLILSAIDRLGAMSDVGSTGDTYEQNSRNWALFTHNIFHVTPQFDVTVGLRYTNERKKLDARFGNDNTACTLNQAALLPLIGNAALSPTIQAILGLSCQGNSTAELNGVSIEDKRKENKLTGTGVLSYKPNDAMLLYASYSRGYKAGGFNLDRSALKIPIFTFASQGGAQALVGRLQFDPETVDAFEIGGKYSAGGILFNFALFRQEFKNFQLNTFDGTVFIVQNINGCEEDLAGLDEDQSKFSTAPNFNPNAATSGACDSGDVGYGVRSQGVEIEASARVTPDLRLNAGITYADTRYRGDLVGTDDGTPLNQALRRLPGRRVSNAPSTVITGSLSWTPPIGGSGMKGLLYVDARRSSGFNTGSDLFPQKSQDGFTVVNGRIGVTGADERWALEIWAQNLLNKNYQQVAFNSPFQEGAVGAPFTDPQFPGGRQIFSSFLAEPRTYGLTLRARFSAPRAAPVEAAPPPPPPPPPPPATQTCADGSVILATEACPAPPPPPPPPPPAPERG